MKVGWSVLCTQSLAVAVSLFLTPAFAQSSRRIDRNVVYGMYSGLSLLMDVHYPLKTNGRGIIFIAGSAFYFINLVRYRAVFVDYMGMRVKSLGSFYRPLQPNTKHTVRHRLFITFPKTHLRSSSCMATQTSWWHSSIPKLWNWR